MILFSVIVANFNNGKFLPDLINSLYQQTYSNWEVIIVDDCSTDDSVKIIQSYVEDERIKFYRHERNLGAGAAFKTAMDNSVGKVIGMLGADDALTKQALEIMVKAHEKYPDASMINSDCFWCDENLNILHKFEHYKPLQPNQSLIRNLTIGSFATFKRSAYSKTNGFDPDFKRAVDHDIYLKLDEVGTLEYIHEPLYLYRKNAIGISQNENGVKAAQFSKIAKINAYKRRIGTKKDNLTKREIRNTQFHYHQMEFHKALSEKNFKDYAIHFIRCFPLINRQTFKPFLGSIKFSLSKLF